MRHKTLPMICHGPRPGTWVHIPAEPVHRDGDASIRLNALDWARLEALMEARLGPTPAMQALFADDVTTSRIKP